MKKCLAVRLPGQQFQATIRMLHECRAAFHPVAVVAIKNSVDRAHFSPVDMPAQHALVPAPARLSGDGLFE